MAKRVHRAVALAMAILFGAVGLIVFDPTPEVAAADVCVPNVGCFDEQEWVDVAFQMVDFAVELAQFAIDLCTEQIDCVDTGEDTANLALETALALSCEVGVTCQGPVMDLVNIVIETIGASRVRARHSRRPRSLPRPCDGTR